MKSDTDTMVGSVEMKLRDLEKVLDGNREFLGRLGMIQGRLSEMSARLHGEQPEGPTTEGNRPVQDGILGQFEIVGLETTDRLGSVEDWLSRIESAV